jgi:hypothetical protein
MTATITPTIPEKVFTRPRMATDIPASITTPDRVETRLGTLGFFDGFPDEKTVETLFDNLDFQRGVQAFLKVLPTAALHALRTGMRSFGADNRTVLITESLLDSRTLIGAGNTETVYNFVWLNAKDSPLVIEVPPKVLGMINDFCGRYVVDVGNAGPDKGSGGKYLLLPPGYTGDVPEEGYFVVRSRTCGNWLFFRGFVANGELQPAVENTKNHFRVYPLHSATDSSPMSFVNISGQPFNLVPATDATFFEHIAAVVQDEPLEAMDPETRGLLAAIGIQKDKPFAPDERMKRILAEAAAVGNATARAIMFSTRDKSAYYYPGTAWKQILIGGYEFSPRGVLNLDARTMYFFGGWGVSPAMTMQMVGIGSQYAMAERDAEGAYLDGTNSYSLHLPPSIPAKDFWSVGVFDPQTRSMLQTDQRLPSIGTQRDGLVVNPDTSVDIYFGPKAPPGKEANWVQTIPGKGWFVMLRLYGPLESWFDKTWRPGEILRGQNPQVKTVEE